jgi:peptidoglycan/LPS O-acetylase OafA/YrhL
MNLSIGEQSVQRHVAFAHEYRPDVDGLRAIAVSAVIAYHFHNEILPGGFLGVDMFFVISGYVITASLAKLDRSSAQSFFLSFYSRRIKRIIPALIICVVVTCLLGALFINPRSEAYSSSMTAGIFSLFGLSNIYFSRAATDYFSSTTQFNLFTHTWSLGVEEQFYLVFPILFWLSVRRSGRTSGRRFLLGALTSLTILSFVLYIWLNRGTAGAAYFMMPPRFWELGIGCLVALASPSATEWVGNRFKLATWLASLLLAIALLAPADRQLYTTPAIVVATATVIMTLRPGAPLYRLLTLPHVRSVGLMSYSLYLWHWSILSISRWTIGVHWWSIPIQIGVILGLSASSYVFVEQQLRIAQWSSSKFVTISLGIIAIVCSAGMIILLSRTGALYTGVQVHFDGIGIGTLLSDKSYGGKVDWHAGSCILSSDSEVGKKIDEDTCTIAITNSTKRRFVVAGNSFSAAEFEMYSVLAESGLGAVTATSSWGASPVPEIKNMSVWSKANDYYWGEVIPKLLSHLNEGDIVILISDVAYFSPITKSSVREDGSLVQLTSGLDRLAKELDKKAVQLIFQSANPFIREARCTPEMANPQWFNIGTTPPCNYYTRAQSLKRREALQGALQAVQAANRNFQVLDLYPILCPDDICMFYNSRQAFLYRDEFSHPSIAADYLARPLLLAAVNKAIEASNDRLHAASRSR